MKLLILAGLVSQLFGSSDPCSNPDVVERVRQQLICSTMINCPLFGGWQKVRHLTYEQYLAGLKVVSPTSNMFSAAVFRNGYRQFKDLDHIYRSTDEEPITYEKDAQRWDCRMTVHWNMPVYKPVLFDTFYSKFVSAVPNTVFIGTDAGWSWVWHQIGFDSRVKPTITIEFGVEKDGSTTIDSTEELWDKSNL